MQDQWEHTGLFTRDNFTDSKYRSSASLRASRDGLAIALVHLFMTLDSGRSAASRVQLVDLLQGESDCKDGGQLEYCTVRLGDV